MENGIKVTTQTEYVGISRQKVKYLKVQNITSNTIYNVNVECINGIKEDLVNLDTPCSKLDSGCCVKDILAITFDSEQFMDVKVTWSTSESSDESNTFSKVIRLKLY